MFDRIKALFGRKKKEEKKVRLVDRTTGAAAEFEYDEALSRRAWGDVPPARSVPVQAWPERTYGAEHERHRNSDHDAEPPRPCHHDSTPSHSHDSGCSSDSGSSSGDSGGGGGGGSD